VWDYTPWGLLREAPGLIRESSHFVWFVGLAAVSALALSRVIAGSELDARLLRYAFVPNVLVTIALLLVLCATIAWGLAAHQEVRQLFDQRAVTLGHITVVSWLFAVLATIRGAIASKAAP
jgi:hypothetical protein